MLPNQKLWLPNSPDTPPLSRLLTSNQPPTQEEVACVAQYVDVIDFELATVCDEIETLEDRLKVLHDRKEFLRHRRTCYLSIPSPVRRIPDDLVAEILQAAIIPTNDSPLSSTSINLKDFLSLRAVCRQWRNVAFSTPKLWTTVWIDFDRMWDTPKIIAMASSFLRRAGPSLPLRVGFKWQERWRNEEYSEEHYLEWLEYLHSQRGRWEEITIRISRKDLYTFEDKLKEWNTDIPWVARTITLEAQPGDTLEPTYTPSPGLLPKFFPHLKRLSIHSGLSGLLKDNQSLFLQGESSEVVDLSLIIEGYDARTYLAKLLTFRNLRELSLTHEELDMALFPLEGDPLPEFPFLEHLKISDISTYSLLKRFRTPNLKRLQLLSDLQQFNWNQLYNAVHHDRLHLSFNDLVDFIERCQDTLQHFRYDVWLLNNEELLTLLQTMPGVHTLCAGSWFRNHHSGLYRGGSEEKEEDEYKPGPYSPTQSSSFLPVLRKLCIHHPVVDHPSHPRHRLLDYVWPRVWRFVRSAARREQGTGQVSGEVRTGSFVFCLPKEISKAEWEETDANARLDSLLTDEELDIVIEQLATCH